MYEENSHSLHTSQRTRLIITAVAIVIVYILWNIPQLSVVLYPFRLFVTFVHEAGHGLAAILTGGEFLDLTVNADGSGLAATRGGSRAIILPAGYLGAALFGASLFYIAHKVPHSRIVSVVLGVIVIVITLAFTGFLSTASFVGLLMGGLLVFVGARLDDTINLLILNILSLLTGLNAVLDLYFLVGNSNIMAGAIRNDAQAFSAEIFPFPAWLLALIWCGIAVVMLGAAVYYSLLKPMRQRRRELDYDFDAM